MQLPSLLTLILPVLCTGMANVVMELNDENFEQVTKAYSSESNDWFVLFKADRCPHCKAMMGDFQQLAEDEQLRKYRFATVDVPNNRATTVRFGIRGFPTLIYIHDKIMYHYKGRRSFEKMKEFLLEVPALATWQNVPPPPTLWNLITGIISAICLELWDALRGQSGLAGIAAVFLLTMGCLIFLAILAMFFMPEVNTEKKNT